ncbi:MAG TPA: GTP-binding protein [Usitatibacter sp.]|nr:GTP-binding protein [Usitatibacter sp.]
MPEGASRSGRIPLTVVGGFLGAGKTTLVNRILAGVAGIRAAVLVNDFGSVNVDAALIADHEGETISLANGCLCCSIGGDLVDALVTVMSRTPAPQWIVIEASGVADPWRIAQVGLADPGLELEGVVVLVDCAAAPAQLCDPLLRDTLTRQIGCADVVVLNKRDLAGAAGLRALRERIAQTAPAVPVLDAAHSDVPLEALTSLAPRFRSRARNRGAELDHAARFQAVTLACKGRLRAARLRELLARMPEGVLRAKGVVRTDEADAEVLQFCGRHGSLRRLESGASADVGKIVAIGLRGRLPVAPLRRALADALFRVED